jgi:hypothetical protein
LTDDENKDLLVVEAKSGKIKKFLNLTVIEKKAKWEGLARDEENNYYVVGSHSVKKGVTDPEKLKNRTHLLRFRLEMTASDINTLKIVEVIEWDISDSLKSEGYNSNPPDNKVKIEGLAVRTAFTKDKKIAKRELIVGLREPDAPVRVLIADITNKAAKEKLSLQRFFTFEPGMLSASKTDKDKTINLRLSSIEYIPLWEGFIILTSTEDEANKFHGNVIWFLADKNIAAGAPVKPEKIGTFNLEFKAEGICVYPDKNNSAKNLRVVLVHDNDGEATHLSSSIQYVNLIR